MILHQLVKEIFRYLQASFSFLVLPELYTHVWVILCMRKNLVLRPDSSQKFESGCSDNRRLLQLLIAKSAHQLDGHSKHPFPWAQVPEMSEVSLQSSWTNELPKMLCSNRKTCQVMIVQLLEYHLLKRSHMKPKWNELF